MRRLALLALALAACGGGVTEVDCVIGLDPSIDPTTLTRLQVVVSDDETYGTYIDLPRGLPSGEGRFVYRPAIASGTLTFYFAALIGNADDKVADNSVPRVMLEPGRAVHIETTLRPLASGPDMAVPLDLSAPTDGGAPDLPPGYSTCKADLGAIFCDDFENGLLWNVMGQDSSHTLGLDGNAHRGSHSLLMHQDGYPLDASVPFYMVYGVRPITFDRPIWVRAFVRMDGYTLNSHSSSIVILENTGGIYAGASMSYVGDTACLSDYGTTMPPYVYPSGNLCSGPGALKADTWNCMEWYLDANLGNSPDGGATAVYVEGAQKIAAQPIHEPAYPQIWLSWTDTGNPGDLPTNLWIDDLVVSYQRIGCGQ